MTTELMKTESGVRRAFHAAAEAEGESERGLLLVGLFKLSKAIFFTMLGIGALKLIHSDVGDLAQRVADRLAEILHFSPENHFVTLLLNKADLIGHHQLRLAGYSSFAYASLCLVEGYGLIRRKEWAEYLTTVLTALALPYEIYEMVHHFAWFKVVVFLTNILILLYLLWVLKRKREKAARRVVSGRVVGREG